jgi:hypothetical protein
MASAVLVGSGWLGLVPGASAAQWQPLPVPAPLVYVTGQLTSVACPSARDCIAVGSPGVAGAALLAERWNGSTWSVLPTPAGRAGSQLLALSCPSARLCVAVGQSASGPLAEIWNGVVWRLPRVRAPRATQPGRLTAVSCPTTRFCSAVGSDAAGILLGRWNGRGWSIARKRRPRSWRSEWLSGLSCVDPTDCLAVGGVSEYRFPGGPGAGFSAAPVVQRWNGRSWSGIPGPGERSARPLIPVSGGGLAAVSCFATDACVAINGANTAERWNGVGWSSRALPPQLRNTGSPPEPTAISCRSGWDCVVVGLDDYGPTSSDGPATSDPLIDRWVGTGWKLQQLNGRNGRCDLASTFQDCTAGLTSVACPRGGPCVAVGYTHPDYAVEPLAASAVGGSWGAELPPAGLSVASARLSDVSCATPGDCMAVGSYTDASGTTDPLAESFAGGAWKIEPLTEDGELIKISCPSTDFCVAVGTQLQAGGFPGAPLLERWDGTTWTAMPNPGNPIDNVSCASAIMCLGLGAADSGPAVVTWNGATWDTLAAPFATGILDGVSCPTTSWCAAVGAQSPTQGTWTDAEYGWNGSGWVSLAAASNAGGPVGPGALGPAFQLSSVACASPTACIATRGYPGETPDALSWNGTVWSAAALQSVAPGAGLYVQSLSCGSPVTCQAVGFYPRGGGALAPFAESWDGTAWSIQPVPTGAVTSGLEEIQLNGVSCPLAIWCLAVGSQEDSPAAMTYH